jgi:hypothetical protein
VVYFRRALLYSAARRKAPHLPSTATQREKTMDATAIGAIASVIGSVVVFVVLGIRINKLMNSCNSQD